MTKSTKNGPILAILLTGTFLCNLNQTLLNVALPSIMSDFNISASQGQWISTGYMLVSGLMIPITAFLIERFKTRPLYHFSITMFLIGSILAGISPSFTVLILGRMIQAIGSGVIMPLMTVTLMNIYPANKIGSIMGLIGLAMNFAPGIGPTMAGWIVQSYNWRYLFYILIPFAALNLLLSFRYLANVGRQKMLKFNLIGVILSSVGLGCLLLGFSNAGDHLWLSFNVLGVIIIGSVITAIFVYQQLTITSPMLNFTVFKSKTFTMTTIINFVVIMALYGGMLLLPMFLQNVRHVTPFVSGVIMLPGACFMAILSPLSGRLFDRYGAKPITIIGLVILIVGTFMFTQLTVHSTVTFAALAQTIRSIGLVLILMPLQTEALKSLPLELVAHGTAMFQTTRQIAGSIGTSILITMMSISSKHFEKSLVLTHSINQQQGIILHGIKSAYNMTTILCLIALILTILLKKNPPLPNLNSDRIIRTTTVK